jgi:serine/threonine protein kinase
MAQTQAAGGPSEPDATGGSTPDAPETWGNNGLIGDGRYRLVRRLGRGGMAEVFGAEDVRLGRTVAVKLMRPDLAEDPVSKARFTREAQSVAGLNHHAVVAVYDSGEEQIGGNLTPYIVMELVEGRTIRELLIGADAPPPDQALIIVSGVLEALAYSHQHGIVHRDIKPANVSITDAGAVKVMDFGIARALHGASSTMTQTGMVMGTPQYLSPEQALGKTVDTRSDLYATGCLLYELLTLRPPFTGETPLSVVYQHVQDDPVPPSEVSAAAPPELDGLVMRALAKDPDDRFQSAEEMRGLVQYGLRMLQEQGSHTGGLWNTGPATTGAAATPVMGVPDTRVGGDTLGHGSTSQLGPPLIMGRPDRDDGGFEGGERDGGGRGGSGVKYALIAFLVVIAVAAGIFAALHTGADGGGKQEPDNPSQSATKDEHTGKTKHPTDDPTRETGLPGNTSTGGDQDSSTPSSTPSQSPSQTTPSPSQTPSGTPSGSSSTGTNGGTGGTGPSTGGNDGGNTDGNPSGGTDTGASQGGSAGGDGGTDSGADGGSTLGQSIGGGAGDQ